MPLFRSNKIIETQIDEFFDQIAEGALVFTEGLKAYLTGRQEDFLSCLRAIDGHESRADKLSKDVESRLYSHSLIPEHRGDVLGLLENSDNIIDTAKLSLHQFAVENPVIPEVFHGGYLRLAESGGLASESVVMAARAFFRDAGVVKDHLFKVHHYEKEADRISDGLKRGIFQSHLDLAHKTQLRYFAHNVEKISDQAEAVADRLAIYAIKRNL